MNKKQQQWFDNHTREDEIPATTIAWLTSLPERSISLIKKFPPSCVVIAKHPLAVPGEGKLGIVVNCNEKELKVIHCEVDDNGFAGMCDPKDLEIIGYWKGLTPEKVETILRNNKN